MRWQIFLVGICYVMLLPNERKCAFPTMAWADEFFSDEKRSVTFNNEFDHKVDLYWKAENEVMKITSIPAKKQSQIESFNNHVFFTVIEEGNKFKRIGPRRIVITNTEEEFWISPMDDKVCQIEDETCDEKMQSTDDIDDILVNMSPKDQMRLELESKGIKVAKHANPEGKPPEVDPSICSDRHEGCPKFARQGECDHNPGWMIVNCPFSCDKCELRDPKIRCNREFLNISTEPIYKPGDMERMFSRIESDFPHYGIKVISKSPWIVTFDNFLTDDEANALVETNMGKWERSTDTGSVNAFGETGRVLSKGRTSTNAWCRSECTNHPDVQNVIRKIEEITMVPRDNYESFQVLQYEIGQKYNAHHDMSKRQTKLSCGPRILTFFLYLSDVEEGGETKFPLLGHSVTPRKGKALLWPSVMDHNLEEMDSRTNHEAATVIKGLKYAANTWIHLYDFEKSNLWGCTGTFD